MLHNNLFEILQSTVESPNKYQNLLNDFGLFFKAVLRDENRALDKTFSTRS